MPIAILNSLLRAASGSIDFIPVSGLVLEFPVNSMNGAHVCSFFIVLGDIFVEGTEFFSIVVTPINTLDRVDNTGTVFIVNDDQSKLIIIIVCTTLTLMIKLLLFLFLPPVIQCPNLQSPSNGDVTVRTLESLNHVQIANYTCNPGYVLNTDQFERVCLVNGNWSGFDPECIRKQNKIISKL